MLFKVTGIPKPLLPFLYSYSSYTDSLDLVPTHCNEMVYSFLVQIHSLHQIPQNITILLGDWVSAVLCYFILICFIVNQYCSHSVNFINAILTSNDCYPEKFVQSFFFIFLSVKSAGMIFFVVCYSSSISDEHF